jgi:two-component system KDP operon response regulator KdpE
VPRVLVVDDEAGVRESIRMVLRGECEVVTVEGVDAALAALRAGGIDLVLLDLVMPGRDGFALLEELAKRKAAPPVLVLTATRDPQAAQRARSLGAADCMRKPFEVEALRARVRELAEKSGRGAI